MGHTISKISKDAIEYRQSAFGLIAYNFGDMAAMMKGKTFQRKPFVMRATNVAALSKFLSKVY